MTRSSAPTVIALAGRRTDAADSPAPRFPLERSAAVQAELEALFQREHALALVCSAACGADILALEVALQLGLRARIVLPFAADRFRSTSVTDRPGDWGPRFDEVLRRVQQQSDVVDLGYSPDAPNDAYDAATRAILSEALTLSQPLSAAVLAVSVWEGNARPTGDATQDFVDCAKRAGMRVLTVSTV